MRHSCHTQEHTPNWAKNGTETSLYSWRVSDPSSLIPKETEDEDGQVAPGAFGLLALQRV